MHALLQTLTIEALPALGLDEITGPDFVLRNKKVLQSHVDGACLGQPPTQHCAYQVFLWRVPIVLTCNEWQTETLSGAERNWLTENCVVEHVMQRVWV